MSNLSEIARAVMASNRPAVVDWHKVAASDARTAEHPDTAANVRGAYRNTEAKNLLSAVFAYDHPNQLDLSTVDRLLIAAEIAARAKGEALPLPAAPNPDGPYQPDQAATFREGARELCNCSLGDKIDVPANALVEESPGGGGVFVTVRLFVSDGEREPMAGEDAGQ